MAISRRGPLNGGVECRWGRQKSRFWANIWHYRVLLTLRPAKCHQHGAAGPWQVVTFTTGSKRRSLLMAGDDDEMFMTRSLNLMPKTTEQHLIVRSDKSVAYITYALSGLHLISQTVTVSVASAARRQLRSASTSDLVVPSTRRASIGDRAFAVAGPRAWNSLPAASSPLNLHIVYYL